MGGTAAGAWKAAVGGGTGVRYFSSGGHGLERRRLHDPRTGANDRQNPGSTRARLYRKAEDSSRVGVLCLSRGQPSPAGHDWRYRADLPPKSCRAEFVRTITRSVKPANARLRQRLRTWGTLID